MNGRAIERVVPDYRTILTSLAFDYKSSEIGMSRVLHADCFEWLSRVPENSIHAIVTDPPYGVKEYEFDQIEKRANGNGGIWRIPRNEPQGNSTVEIIEGSYWH